MGTLLFVMLPVLRTAPTAAVTRPEGGFRSTAAGADPLVSTVLDTSALTAPAIKDDIVAASPESPQLETAQQTSKWLDDIQVRSLYHHDAA